MFYLTFTVLINNFFTVLIDNYIITILIQNFNLFTLLYLYYYLYFRTFNGLEYVPP